MMLLAAPLAVAPPLEQVVYSVIQVGFLFFRKRMHTLIPNTCVRPVCYYILLLFCLLITYYLCSSS